MVSVKPFRGFLAAKESAQKLISPPYDVINSAEARVMAAGNAQSFLHVNKPEIDLPVDQDPYADIVYQTGRDNLHKFIDQGLLVRDTASRYYIYSQEMDGREQIGIVSASSIIDYEEDRIKKHERTLEKKEKDRTMLTHVQSANVGPVFLTYRNDENTSIVEKMEHIVKTQEPYKTVVQNQDATDKPVSHRLWQIDTSENKFFENEFKGVSKTYVADGHHRSAAAYNVGKMRREQAKAKGIAVTGEEEFNYFMTIIYPSNQLDIMDYNRVLTNLNGLTGSEFLQRLQQGYGNIEKMEASRTSNPKPLVQGTTSLFIDDQWYNCTVRPEIIEESVKKANGRREVATLDVQLLNDRVLNDILGIENPRNDARVDFVGGSRGIQGLYDRMNTDSLAAFALHPISIEQLLDVADAGLSMPPKCTWFEPKPRSGFVVRVFDD